MLGNSAPQCLCFGDQPNAMVSYRYNRLWLWCLRMLLAPSERDAYGVFCKGAARRAMVEA
jgi:hypothetical protein